MVIVSYVEKIRILMMTSNTRTGQSFDVRAELSNKMSNAILRRIPI